MSDEDLPVEPGTGPWTAARLTRAKGFHTDPECISLASGKRIKPVSETAIEWHDLEECSRCAGTAESGDGGNPPVLAPDGGERE